MRCFLVSRRFRSGSGKRRSVTVSLFPSLLRGGNGKRKRLTLNWSAWCFPNTSGIRRGSIQAPPLRGSDVARNPDQHHDRIRPAYQVDSLEDELERTIAGDHGARGLAASRQRMPERSERDSINSAARVRDWAQAFVIAAEPNASTEVPAAPSAQALAPPVHLTRARTGAERSPTFTRWAYPAISTEQARPGVFRLHLEYRTIESVRAHPGAIAADARGAGLFGPSALAPRPDHHDHQDQDERRHDGADEDRRQGVSVHREDDPADDLRNHQCGPGRLTLHSVSVAHGGCALRLAAIGHAPSERGSTPETPVKSRLAPDRPSALSAPLRLHVAVDAEPDEQRAQGDEAVATESCVEELSDDADRETRCDALGRRQGLQSHRHDRAHGVSVAHGGRS
jgi:hypothetical protein